MDGVNYFEFMDCVLTLLKEEKVFQIQNTPRDWSEQPVVNFKHPKELEELLNLSLEEPTENLETLKSLCREIIKYSVKTSNPHFHSQLYGGADIFGLGGSLISEALNTNQYTYEVAPAFTLVEQALIKHVQNKIGFTQADGIFSPGGSISNMYAMVLARYERVPEIKAKGATAFPVLVAFTSEDTHYSLQKSAHWLGIGTDNLVTIKTNMNGQMDVSELDSKIGEATMSGKIPFFVNATAGTTVLGAIDPLENIANMCLKYNLWFHVDACLGGTLLLSAKYKSRLNGIQRADSIAWNPHKMLGAPLQCSLFLTKHNTILHRCNSASAMYLFQQDKFYDTCYDTGDKSLQCGRKVDAFKLWVMWKARGDTGFEKLVDNAMDCAIYFRKKIEQRDGFKLVIPEFEMSNVCFWYIPKSLRGQEETEEWWQRLHRVAPIIKEKMIISGTLMLSYTPIPHKKLYNFFRMVTTCQPPPSYQDMDYIVQKIEMFGENL